VAPAPGRATERPRLPAVVRPAAHRDSTEGLPIATVTVVPHEVYDPVPEGRIARFHRLANELHICTRASTVREQLLFRPGDRWSDAIGAETARNLRALDFLEPRRIAAARRGDSVDVTVETRDFWTTSPEVNLESSGGHHYGSIGLTERNLLGFGKSVSLAYRQETTGRSRLFAYDDPAVFGSRHQLRYTAGRGSEGATDAIGFALPFYSLETPMSYGEMWGRSTSVTRLYNAGAEAANFDERHETGQIFWGYRMPNSVPVERVQYSFEIDDRRFGPSRLTPGAPQAFAGGEDNLRIHRVAAEWSWWKPRYVELLDIDRMDRIEDFDLGPRVAFKAGVAPRAFGSTTDEGYTRGRLGAGADTRAGFGWFRAEGSSRYAPEAREILGSLDARWYALPVRGHTLVAAAYGTAGTRTERDYQAIVGGLTGLRAYPIEAVAGRRLWRFNLEERWLFSPPEWQLLRLGSAAFYDAARAWGLGAGGTGWYKDAGIGLRIGLPQFGLTEVVRIDVAWTIDPPIDGRHAPVLSFGSSQAF
jgi:hypothetical protein